MAGRVAGVKVDPRKGGAPAAGTWHDRQLTSSGCGVTGANAENFSTHPPSP
jgi:hypothetical protein